MSSNIVERFDIVRDAGKVGELEVLDGAQISMSTGSEIKTSISLSARPSDKINYFTDMIRPMRRENGVWQSYGNFVIASIDMAYVDQYGVVGIKGYDQSYRVKRRAVEDAFTLKRGEQYIEVIQQMLFQCGITMITPTLSKAVLQSDREDWEIGTSYLTIINQLLMEISYEDLWFDAGGFARLEPIVKSELADHVYKSGSASVVSSQYTQNNDLFNQYNVFRAIVSSPDFDYDLQAVAVNDDPASPISIPNIGRNPAPVYRPDNIASQEDLQKYVEEVRNRSMIATETITIETAISQHGVGDSIYVDLYAAKGLYFETSWDITLGPGGTMKHTAKKDVVL